MAFERFPTAMQSVYIDLRSRHLGQRVNELGGTPKLRSIDGKSYWYAEVAIKGRKVQRYIGPDDEDTRQRVEQAKAAVEDTRSARKGNRALVKQLEVTGAPRLDPNTGTVLNAMATTGVFRLGGTLVGTHAYRLYAMELGVRLRGLHEATQDVDIAAFERLSLAIGDQVDPSLQEALGGLGMEPAPSLDPKRPTRWKTRNTDLDIDFLAPSFSEEEGPVHLAALDVWAQGLHFLNFLIAEPIQAVALYLDGILVQVPRPERYAVHKLILAQHRNRANRIKARKDLDQARDLIEIMAVDRPDDLEDAYVTAMENGPAWREALGKSLNSRDDIRTLIPFVKG